MPQSAVVVPSATAPTVGPAGSESEVTDGQSTTTKTQWSGCSHRADGWGSRAHPHRSLPCQPAGAHRWHQAPQASALQATSSGTTSKGLLSTSTTCPQRGLKQAVLHLLPLVLLPPTARAAHPPLHLPLPSERDLSSCLLPKRAAATKCLWVVDELCVHRRAAGRSATGTGFFCVAHHRQLSRETTAFRYYFTFHFKGLG